MRRKHPFSLSAWCHVWNNPPRLELRVMRNHSTVVGRVEERPEGILATITRTRKKGREYLAKTLGELKQLVEADGFTIDKVFVR